jgi:TPR repeat protein
MKPSKPSFGVSLVVLMIAPAVVAKTEGKTDGKAGEQLEKACEAKQMKACFDVAKMQWRGDVTGWIDWKKAWQAFQDGVNIDKDKALAMHQKACDGGAAAACYDVGIMYSNGWGVAKDEARGTRSYQKACEGGDPAGCYGFGQSLRQGKGVAKDEARALLAYKKSCDGAYAPGCYKHAFMYEEGLGVAKDLAKAAPFYQKSCERGDSGACAKLAQLYQKSCEGRNLRGCHKLAGLYEKGAGVAKDPAKAVALDQEACKRGFTEACANAPAAATK